jgi:hypothetical protein
LNELDLGSRLTPTRSHPHSELKRPNDQFHFFADKGVWVKEPLQKMAQNRIDQDSKMMLASKQDFVGKKVGELPNWRGRVQGCQIFLGTMYQIWGKGTKLPQNIPVGHSITVRETKCP